MKSTFDFRCIYLSWSLSNTIRSVRPCIECKQYRSHFNMTEDLYKSRGIHSKEYRQSERRHALLKIQKQRRNDLLDEHRSIEPFKKIFRRQSNSKYVKIKNQLMLSEWLMELPDDIEKWYIRPCPKGNRVLVIAVDGTTRVFNKYGAYMKRFHSALPGDRQKQGYSLTILDCIYVANSEEYFVLDTLAYGNQVLTDCDAEFRFFWIESKIRELNLDQVTDNNEHPFRIIEKFNCGDEEAVNEALSNYPFWLNNQPELDGFLFYHGEASYVNGKTPLVGWLFAFMIPELLNVSCFNQNYLIDKPVNYVNYLTYIKEFDENLAKKQKNRRKNKRVEWMEAEKEVGRIEEEEEEGKGAEHHEMDENSASSVVREAMELEKSSADNDEYDYEFNDFVII